ncbi:shikimate kinase [Leifsonia sp. LS1]|uniref:shikimate kinase n=1 Tax=Leifsonia sp. LS1 TaxID=2828483 RepID=UPI001CFC8866|nr:shikimate kinase [Leifsonia sp. LS1]GIT80299.1 shikimate kinase [Leifsonia sp. LS1]
MTVVLIGPPAAGKTRLGKRLAKRLGLAFVDTDARVVAEHGAISEIFADHGESHFRALERAAVVSALAEGGVVSLGGGAVLDLETRADLAGRRVVLLTVQPEAIAHRITGGKRPLITDIESWKRLVAERAELYASLADYTADTSSRPIDTIVEEIAEWVEQEEGHR